MSRAPSAVTSAAARFRHAADGTTPLASEQWMNSAACAAREVREPGPPRLAPCVARRRRTRRSTGADTTSSAGRSSAYGRAAVTSVSVGCVPQRREQPGPVLRGLRCAVGPHAAERLGERPDRVAQLADAALLHGPFRRRDRLARERHVQHVVVDARVAEGAVRQGQQQLDVAAAERRPLVHGGEDATDRPGGRSRSSPLGQQLVPRIGTALGALDEHDHDRAQLVRRGGLEPIWTSGTEPRSRHTAPRAAAIAASTAGPARTMCSWRLRSASSAVPATLSRRRAASA